MLSKALHIFLFMGFFLLSFCAIAQYDANKVKRKIRLKELNEYSPLEPPPQQVDTVEEVSEPVPPRPQKFPVKFNGNKRPQVILSTLLNNVFIDHESGYFALGYIDFFNLPTRDVTGQMLAYGWKDDDHKLEAHLAKDGETLGSFLFYTGYVSRSVTSAGIVRDPLAMAQSSATAAVKLRTGSHRLEFTLDGKPFYEFSFEVEKVKGLYHLTFPWEYLSVLDCSEGGDNPLSVKLYLSRLSGKHHNRYVKNVRVKLYQDERLWAIDEGMPGDFLNFTTQNSWNMVDVPLVSTQGQRLSKQDLLKHDGDYVLSVTTGKQVRYYPFQIKAGKVICETLTGHDVNIPATKAIRDYEGYYWLTQTGKTQLSLPKWYSNRDQTKDHHIGASVARRHRFRYKKPGRKAKVKDGFELLLHLSLDSTQEKKLKGKDVTWLLTASTSSGMLAQQVHVDEYWPGDSLVFPVLENPNKADERLSRVFIKSLSELPRDRYDVRFQLLANTYWGTEVVGNKMIRYKSKRKNKTFNKWLANSAEITENAWESEGSYGYRYHEPGDFEQGLPRISGVDFSIDLHHGQVRVNGTPYGTWIDSSYYVHLQKLGKIEGNTLSVDGAPVLSMDWEGHIFYEKEEVAEIDNEGYITRQGKKFARIARVDLNDHATVMKLLASFYFHTDFF